MCTAGAPFFMGIPRSKDRRRFQEHRTQVRSESCLLSVSAHIKKNFILHQVGQEKKLSYDTIIALIKECICKDLNKQMREILTKTKWKLWFR